MSGTDALINDGVIAVLQDRLHTTLDDELQAAIWQTLDGIGVMAAQIEAARFVLRVDVG